MSLEVLPFVDEGLGNSSYLVPLGDDAVLAIDPSRNPARYLAAAERRKWKITGAFETHLHADFISGGRELSAFDAKLFAPAGSRLEFDHHALDPGDETALNGLTVRALATPGHTPEHLAYLVLDGNEPLALFSGGSLLVGSVARTDLIDPNETESLTRRMFRSLQEVLAPLPDDLAVYPTHGFGSFCSAGTSGSRITTLGAERKNNPYLHTRDEDRFVRLLLGSLGTYPAYYRQLRARNRQGPRLYGPDPPPLKSLSADEVRGLAATGGVVVDTRRVEEWAAGHLPGSLSIRLRAAFATWLGWLVDIDTPIAFVSSGLPSDAEIIQQCLSIGYENLAGKLEGGVQGWVDAGHDLVRTDIITFDEVDNRQVVDVRQTSEWNERHIAGAVHAELGSLDSVPITDGPLGVHCAHGERAATGVSVLERAGRTDVALIRDDLDTWLTAQRARA